MLDADGLVWDVGRLLVVQRRMRALCGAHPWLADAIRAAGQKYLWLVQHAQDARRRHEVAEFRMAERVLERGFLVDPAMQPSSVVLVVDFSGLCPSELAAMIGRRRLDALPEELQRVAAPVALKALRKYERWTSPDLSQEDRDAMDAAWKAAVTSGEAVEFDWRCTLVRPEGWQQPPEPGSKKPIELARFGEEDYRTLALHRLGGLCDVGSSRPIVPKPATTGDFFPDMRAEAAWGGRVHFCQNDQHPSTCEVQADTMPANVAEQMLACVEAWANEQADARLAWDELGPARARAADCVAKSPWIVQRMRSIVRDVTQGATRAAEARGLQMDWARTALAKVGGDVAKLPYNALYQTNLGDFLNVDGARVSVLDAWTQASASEVRDCIIEGIHEQVSAHARGHVESDFEPVPPIEALWLVAGLLDAACPGTVIPTPPDAPHSTSAGMDKLWWQWRTPAPTRAWSLQPVSSVSDLLNTLEQWIAELEQDGAPDSATLASLPKDLSADHRLLLLLQQHDPTLGIPFVCLGNEFLDADLLNSLDAQRLIECIQAWEDNGLGAYFRANPSNSVSLHHHRDYIGSAPEGIPSTKKSWHEFLRTELGPKVDPRRRHRVRLTSAGRHFARTLGTKQSSGQPDTALQATREPKTIIKQPVVLWEGAAHTDKNIKLARIRTAYLENHGKTSEARNALKKEGIRVGRSTFYAAINTLDHECPGWRTHMLKST